MPRPERQGSSPIDWNRFTHFRSRNTRKDLERLLNEAAKSRSGTKELLEQPDRVGLYPIHWAAINNRSDMIECLYEAGSPLAKPCRNRLFANGSPLHLAAMNGNLEAAAMLLSKSRELQSHKTRPKFLITRPDENNNVKDNDAEKEAPKPVTDKSRQDAKNKDDETNHLLELRDAEGQTPLMRTAVPRSKRLDAIRDLLRKNFWSLSGRPAEMALFLISMGADWRSTEPQAGMNLLHLAIVNDYDDIVSLLLVLDKDLIETPTSSIKREAKREGRNEPSTGTGVPKSDIKREDTLRRRTSYATDTSSGASTTTSQTATPATSETGSTNTSLSGAETDTSSAYDDEEAQRRALVRSRRERADELLAAGLKPLELAILHGRVSAISKLWNAGQQLKKAQQQQRKPPNEQGSQIKVQREALRESRQSHSYSELKRILVKACYSNKQELAKFAKPALLKGILAIDLACLALVWAPAYASHGLTGGLFFVSYVISMALTLRVILKNPGYLRRNSVQYLAELAKLLDGRSVRKAPSGCNTEKAESQEPPNDKPQANGRQAAPLIKLEDPNQLERKEDKRPPETTAVSNQQQTEKQKPLAIGLEGRVPSVDTFHGLQDKVRLFCHKCQCIRRPRSRHCNSCNHCVQDFDHHCVYLGCCVARFNRLDFLLAMVALSITSIYGTALWSMHSGGNESRLWHILGFVWIFKYALIGGAKAFLILRRACLGVTLFEEIRSKRIRRTFGRLGPPEEISKSHRAFSTLKGAFWRYSPDRFLTGDLPQRTILANLSEFANYISPDEYLLTFICTDTPLARSLTSSDSRMKQFYKFV